PSCVTLSPSHRTAYTANGVVTTFSNRLNVADWVARLRRMRSLKTARRPSLIEASTEDFSWGAWGSGSGLRIRIRVKAENRYEAASTNSTIGAVRIPTSKPARP